MGGFEEAHAEAAAGFAVAGGVGGRNGQSGDLIPAQDQADGILTGSVGFKDLREPSQRTGRWPKLR